MSTLRVEGIHANQYHLVHIEDGVGNTYEVWLLTIPLSWDASAFPMVAIVDSPGALLWKCQLREIDTPRLTLSRSVMEGPLRPLPLSDHISEVALDVVEAYLQAHERPIPQDFRVSRYHREPVI